LEAFENEEEIKIKVNNIVIQRDNILIDEDLDNYSNASRTSDIPRFDNLILNDRKKMKITNELNPIFLGIRAPNENKFIIKQKQSPYIEQSSLMNVQKLGVRINNFRKVLSLKIKKIRVIILISKSLFKLDLFQRI
jgi:hypothetical protein